MSNNSTPSRRKRPRTLRRAQLQMTVLITCIIALIYTVVIFRSYDGGLDDALKLTFDMDAKDFERRYARDPAAPLPITPQRQSWLSWEQVPANLRAHFSDRPITLGELHEAKVNFSNKQQTYASLVAREAHFIMMYPYQLNDGNVLYMFADFEVALFTKDEVKRIDDRLDFTVPLGLGVLACVLVLSYLFTRRVNRATNQLSVWADQMTLDTMDQHPPDFRYAELNRIASQLQSSFQRISKLVQREHHFLRNASHELRTPIAITRANLELLDKIGIADNIQRPIARIQRANYTMQQLTETLLWLSRDMERQPPVRALKLQAQLNQHCEDLNWLLDGKAVHVAMDIGNATETIYAPPAALQIVLHNLIRNAFQHTQAGEVTIRAQGNQLTIRNHDEAPLDSNHPDSVGLGVLLVKQICKRLHWPFEMVMHSHGVSVTLQLPASNSLSAV